MTALQKQLDPPEQQLLELAARQHLTFPDVFQGGIYYVQRLLEDGFLRDVSYWGCPLHLRIWKITGKGRELLTVKGGPPTAQP